MRVRKLPVFLISTLLGIGFITLAGAQETAEVNTGVLVRETGESTADAGEAATVGETISLEAVPARGAAERAPSESRASFKQAKVVLPASALGDHFVHIIRQAEDHLLITVGDMVYLPTPGFMTLKAQDSFFIYKYVKKPATNSGMVDWLERVGRLKIVASLDELTLGRVIAARDIIRKGDFVLLRREP